MPVAPTITLNDGNHIPAIGLGSSHPTSFNSDPTVIHALEIGYRHFDTAWVYGNQTELGDALRKGLQQLGLKREDVFVTSKFRRYDVTQIRVSEGALLQVTSLEPGGEWTSRQGRCASDLEENCLRICETVWNNFHKKESAVKNCQATLDQLKLDYVDLLLIHWPIGFKEDPVEALPVDENGQILYSDVDFLETWEGLEECLKKGLTKSIGVSNFSVEALKRLLDNCSVKPTVNQVESHPYNNQKELLDFCKKHDIILTTYAPLGAPYTSPASGNTEAVDRNLHVLDDPVVLDIAKKHNKTPAEVSLRWAVQRGTVPLPRSNKKHRLQENFDIFDFELADDEMKKMNSLNKFVRAYPVDRFKDHFLFSSIM